MAYQNQKLLKMFFNAITAEPNGSVSKLENLNTFSNLKI